MIPSLPDTEVCMFVKEGNEIRKFTNSNDAIGQVVVKGASLEKCREMIDKAMNSIIIRLNEAEES